MKQTFITLTVCLTLAACATKPVAPGPVRLGDSERTMVAKMISQGAHDVTTQTSAAYYASIVGAQRYYWWELPDKTIVVTLVAAPPRKLAKVVVTIETSEPGLGIQGTENWRDHKLKLQTSVGMMGK